MTTIAESFQHLLTGLEPDGSLANAAEVRIAAIRTRLQQAFDLKRIERVGSFVRGTFIRTSSDVDVFAVISRDDARWGDQYMSSNTVLDRLRAELEDRYANTRVSRDGPAIVVGFNDCAVDVVPAFFLKNADNGWPIYAMPNGEGNWMQTAPGLHNKYLREQDTASIGKIRGTARILKFWRECRTQRVPISSFHIEMILASEGICLGAKSYAACTYEILQRLAQRECRALQDPEGISGLIGASKTERQRQSALASIRNSRDHAASALDAIAQRDLTEARRQWDIVFNGQFPW